MSKSRKPDIAKYSRMFGALSNPHRLKIFLDLIQCCCGECVISENSESQTCVGDLGRDLKISPSTLSHHLKELRDSGLITMERRGQNVECTVGPEIIEDLVEFFLTTPSLRQILSKPVKK